MISAKELLAAGYNSDSLFNGSGRVYLQIPHGMDYSSFKNKLYDQFPSLSEENKIRLYGTYSVELFNVDTKGVYTYDSLANMSCAMMLFLEQHRVRVDKQPDDTLLVVYVPRQKTYEVIHGDSRARELTISECTTSIPLAKVFSDDTAEVYLSSIDPIPELLKQLFLIKGQTTISSKLELGTLVSVAGKPISTGGGVLINLQTMEARALYPTRKQVVDKEARKRYLKFMRDVRDDFRGAAALGTFNGQRTYELNNLYRASCAKADIKLDGLRYVDISTVHADYDSETIKNTFPGFIFDTYQPGSEHSLYGIASLFMQSYSPIRNETEALHLVDGVFSRYADVLRLLFKVIRYE